MNVIEHSAMLHSIGMTRLLQDIVSDYILANPRAFKRRDLTCFKKPALQHCIEHVREEYPEMEDDVEVNFPAAYAQAKQQYLNSHPY